jgi:hypothetical protein
MKYKHVPFPALWQRYNRTITSTFIVLMESAVIVLDKFFGVDAFVPSVFGAFFLGQMIERYQCERFHDREWFQNIIGRLFNSTVALIEAESIRKEGL